MIALSKQLRDGDHIIGIQAAAYSRQQKCADEPWNH